MPLHENTFEPLKPTNTQLEVMHQGREETRRYAQWLDEALPDGPDKTYILRRVRETAMWINVVITRHPDGAPRV